MSDNDFEEGRNRRTENATAISPAGDHPDESEEAAGSENRGDAADDDRFGRAVDRGGNAGPRNDAGRDGGDNGAGGGNHVPARSQRRDNSLAHANQTSPEIYGRDLYGTGAASQDDDVAIDYRKYLGILIKHRWLIAGITAVSLSLGLFYTLLQTPTYRASATIQIKREVANISGIAGLEPVEAGRGAEFYQTQYELLKSRSLAERVVASLNLADKPALFEPPPSGWDKLHDMIFSSGHAEAPNIAQRQSMALGAVLDGLSVEPVRSSSIVRINFDSRDPVIAQEVANAVADNFITSNIERSFEASAYARQFLEERLQELRLKLEESERALVAYAEEQDILTTGSEQSLSTVNLTEVNSVLAEAAKERLRQEMLWQQVQAMEGAGLPQNLETEAIENLRERRSELVLDYDF